MKTQTKDLNPVLATTSKTDKHNDAIKRLGHSGQYKSLIHEIRRHFTYKFRGQDHPDIENLEDSKTFSKCAANIATEVRKHADETCILSISLPKDYQLSVQQSLQLVKLQVAAGLTIIRIFFGGSWNLTQCKTLIKTVGTLVKSETHMVIACIDLNMYPARFKWLYNRFAKPESEMVSFIYRAPAKNSKLNYFLIDTLKLDGVKKHMSNLPWRRKEVERSRTMPLAVWAIGITSCAFGGRPSFAKSDEDDEAQEQTWNVPLDYVKFYNPQSKMIDRLMYFPTTQTCPCPIHNNKSIVVTSEEIQNTDLSAIYSSLHDMHEIQRELSNLGHVDNEAISSDKKLLELYSFMIGERRNKLHLA